MRRILLLILAISLSAGWLISCGSSGSKVGPPQSQKTQFLFLQDAGNYLFTPMVGKFTSAGSGTVFTAYSVVDASTNQPITGQFFSIVLSPDGTKAAIDLYGGIDGNNDQMDIYVVNADGSLNPVALTNDVYDDLMPQFSPDGRKIVFASLRPVPGSTSGEWQWQIALVNTDGSGVEQILPIPMGIDYQMAPTFSPDGTRIATQATGTIDGVPFSGILVTNLNGTNAIALTNPLFSDTCDYCQDQMPSFSPDGRKIAFSRENYTQSPSVSDIYIMNADGTNVTKLTDGVGINSDPLLLNVAGMGQTIVFNSNRDNLSITSGAGFDLYSIGTDGTGLTRLTNNTLFDGMSEWWYNGPGSGTAARSNIRTDSHRPPHRDHPPIHRFRW